MRILNNMKKAMLFVAASLFSVGSLFAETEKSPAEGYVKDTAVEGVSYTLDGTYIAGAGGEKYGRMENKGLKLRTNKNNSTVTFTVKEGYVIKGITLIGCANDTAKVKDVHAIYLTSATVDGGDNLLASQMGLLNTRVKGSVDIALTGIEAKSAIKLTFDNSNVVKNSQFCCTYTIEYEALAAEPEVPAAPDSLIIGEETVLQVGKSYVLGKHNNMYKVKFTAEKDGFLSITPSQKVNSTGWKINGASSTFTKDANGGIDKKGMAAGSVFTGQFYCSAAPSADNVYELVVTFEEGTPYSPLTLKSANPANGGEWSGAAQYKTSGTKGAAHFEFSTYVSANTVASIKVGEKTYSPVKLTVSTSSTAALDVTAMADTLKKAAADGLIKAGDTFTLTLSNIEDKEFAVNKLADQTFTYTMASTACTGISPTASTSRSNMMPDVTFSFDGNVALADTAKFYLLNLFNNEKIALTGEVVDGTKVKVTIPAIEGLLPRLYNIVAEGVTTAEGDKVITYGNEPGKLVASYGTSNGFFKGTTSLANWAKVGTLEGFTATYPAAVMKVEGIATKPISIKKVDSYLGTEEEIPGVTLKDSVDANNPNVILFTVSPAITESGTYRLEVPQKHYWAKETYTEEDAKLSAPKYAYFQASITLTIDVEDPNLLPNLVDSLNALVVEVEAYQKTLDPNDLTQASMIESLTQNIAAAKAAAEKMESASAVNAALNELRNLYVSITTYLAGMEIQAAEAVMAEFENPTDKAGFAAAINKVSEIISYLATGLGDIVYTVADLNAAVDAMKAAKEAFIKENSTVYLVQASWNFRDDAQFAKDTRVAVASLTEEFAATPDGTMLYKSTQEEFAGLVFQPAKDDNTQSWWVRPRNTGTDYGLAAINITRWFAIQDVHPGYKVTVESKSAMPLADSTMVSAIVQNASTTCGYGVSYTYTIAKDGMLAFSNNGCYMYNIIVEAPVLDMVTANEWNFRDEAQFAKDTRVAVASLVTEYAKLADGTVLYESTQDEFAGLVFQPAKDDNTQSWWVRARNTGTDYGLAAINVTRWFGIKDLKAGSKVTVEAKSAMPLADSTMVLAIVKNESTLCGQGVSYTYTMAKDGMLAFSNNGCYMYRIAVEKPVVYYETTGMNFRDEAQFAKDTRVAVASLVTEYATLADGTVLYESTQDEFAGLAFQPAKDDNTQSWWVRARNTGTDYGLAAINVTRWFAVTGLQAGEYVTVESKSAMPLADSTMVAEIVKNESTKCGQGVSYTYKMAKGGYLAFSNNGCYMYYIEVKRIGGSLAAPKITVSGDYHDVNTVEMSCETSGALIYYTIDGGETIEYTAPFSLAASCKVTAWSEANGNKSAKVNKQVTAGFIDVPTATITGVNGLDRTVTLACAVDSAAIVYKTAEEAEYAAYTAPFVISDTTTVWAIASKVSAVADTLTFVSDTMKVELAAGTEIRLAAPTFAKAAVDSLTNVEYQEKGLAAYLIAADQASVLCTPTATINYEFYALNPETGRISETPTLSGEYSDTLKALPYGKLVAKASAVGYAGSEAYTWLKAPAKLEPVWVINLDSVAKGQWIATGATDENLIVDMTTRDVLFNGKFRSNATGDFATVSFGDSALNDNFVLQTGVDWELRYRQGAGLYNNMSGDRGFGFANLKKGQIIHVQYQDATQAIFMDGPIAQNLSMTNGNDVYYDVTADGNATIAMNRYFFIHKVGVYMNSSITQTPELAVTNANGKERTVELTSGTLGADIFYSVGKETIEETLELDSLENVVIVRDTTLTFSEYQLYTEPIVIAENTYFRAYAEYQDVLSETREAYVLAGTDVQLAQPVIKYEGNTAEGLKMFTISVDNSEVVAAPACDIYYTMPGAAEVLYANDTIKVATDVYGWMSAVAKREGYLNSAAARRYLDSRESYTETYRVIDNTTETMYDVLGDVEIDYSEDIDVVQEAMVKAEGRVYLHRKVEDKVMNVVMPFLFNAKSHATDETGKVLERGVDYKVYKINASAEQCTEVHTGNVVAGAQGYLVEVLCGAKEIIFVSNGTAVNFGIAQTTFNQPTEGYAVKTNKLFQPVVLECAAYLLNEEGTAFEQVPAGSVVAPFQACIMADNTILAQVTTIAVDPKNADGIYGLDNEGKEIETIKYITVSGVEVETPEAGVHIQQIIYKDGSVKTIKVVTK